MILAVTRSRFTLKTLVIIKKKYQKYAKSLLMKELKKNREFNLKILITGMHLLKKYGNTHQEIIRDGFNINYKIKN